jgi:hypothetical protein
MGLTDAGRAASIATRQSQAAAHAAQLRPVVAVIMASGTTSQLGLARELNRRGLPTPRGGAWGHVQVAALLRRLEAA